jgi:type IV pilus assembly protein PilM
VANAVGVNIGTRSITVAEVKVGRDRPTVVNFGGIDLPADSVREGEILDVASVAAALRELMSSTKVRSKRVWLGVANQRVVVRQIDLPWMDPDELRASLRYQVQEYIPIPVDEAELDVHVVTEFTTDDGQRMQRVLLVAGHRDMVAAHVECATRAGLKPVGVDLNPFAVLRAMGDDSGLSEGNEVIIDVGAGVTNVVVHDGGIPTFVRILVMGGDSITEALASGLGISPEEAEAAKRAQTVGVTADTAGQIVTQQAETFIDEIRSSLDYYQAQTGSAQIGGVVLTGGGALLAGLSDGLASTLRLPVSIGNPFDRWPAKDTVYGPEDLARVGPPLATAIGLALGGLE